MKKLLPPEVHLCKAREWVTYWERMLDEAKPLVAYSGAFMFTRHLRAHLDAASVSWWQAWRSGLLVGLVVSSICYFLAS